MISHGKKLRVRLEVGLELKQSSKKQSRREGSKGDREVPTEK